MTDIEVRFVGEMERLEIGPGDRFVLTTDQPISQKDAARIQTAWATFAGEDVKLLILDQHMKLGAINVDVKLAPNVDDPDNRALDVVSRSVHA